MVKIIAEAGVNHNGSKDLAFQLVDAAHAAGVDIVKFQTFKAKNLVTKSAQQAEYQVQNTGVTESQFDMLSRLELDYDTHKSLVAHCKNLGIEFLSTAFDKESLDFLVNDLSLKTLKIPSGELTNAPFVLEHARTGCDLIVSTGMANLAEIEAALAVIAFGLVANDSQNPSQQAFEEVYNSDIGQKALKQKVTILHCTTEYPAPVNEINLNAMSTLRNTFHLATGYSDHSAGITIPIAAIALGAQLIEKHFTLDKSMPGPDHKASLEPDELKDMVQAIRDVEMALGNGIKGPQPSEIKNKSVARKSLVAAQYIKAGDTYTEKNLTIKRPGNGISPNLYWSLLGKTANRDYLEGDLIYV
ncbi:MULTISPECIES: N-acetylneuraminate synthase [unclassified Psychrobacter]|uniref:N-acetylneuraminate synthase n=1 Tax=unclassified Psychrobacter TaxID=196806 RepID=UPI0025B48CC2|nr:MULTISPECIES: N-acetylneuraminate synthase [unclassified Psychrobacter]MDN3454373.1 N-acetylneuraminate synthase [Psychrobacter sp. APC 3350]MDN3502053.1 N-acetylneuraminate synthase [Psychrobacter sp. 5A.1]